VKGGDKKGLKKGQNVDFLCNTERSYACSLRIICVKRWQDINRKVESLW